MIFGGLGYPCENIIHLYFKNVNSFLKDFFKNFDYFLKSSKKTRIYVVSWKVYFFKKNQNVSLFKRKRQQKTPQNAGSFVLIIRLLLKKAMVNANVIVLIELSSLKGLDFLTYCRSIFKV